MINTTARQSGCPPGQDCPDARQLRRDQRNQRADQIEERLAVPVIVAALVSVPAVFLTTAQANHLVVAGHVLNWASLTVLTAESVVLFLLTGNRLRWLWRHKWTVGILLIAIPAVLLAAMPGQVLRLVVQVIRFLGALRILRATRIIRAGRVLARRIGWAGPWRYLPILAGSVLAAGFVAVVLSDQTSLSRDVITRLPGWSGAVLVVIAGGILAGATFIVLRHRQRRTGPQPPEPEPSRSHWPHRRQTTERPTPSGGTGGGGEP